MIVICWEQLPVYAARAIGAFVKTCNQEVRVLRVAFKRFDIKGAEAMTGCPIIEVGRFDKRRIAEVVGAIPEVILAGGWASPCFIRWAKEVRRNGGKTILLSDEAFTNKGLKQQIRRMRFLIQFNKLFDRIFVVGEGAKKLFRDFYGLPESRLISGVYGSDPKLFFNGPALAERPKRFIYVGHYDANKNVGRMCEAFKQAVARLGDNDWTLEVYGGGEQEAELKQFSSDRIHINGFIQAEQLGPLYREARCFVLGSFSEKWGVVVHEAAASGCMLLLSDKVGARYDFAKAENSAIFDPGSTEEFRDGFVKLMRKSDEELARAQEISVRLAQNFSPEIFARNLNAALG